MIEKLIYILTKCGFIKWKKRFYAENIIGSYDKYYYSNKYFKLKLGQSRITYPLVTSLFVFNQKTNRSIHISVSNKILEKLVSFLDKQYFENYYITEHSIRLATDIIKKRQMRILLVTKKLEVI